MTGPIRPDPWDLTSSTGPPPDRLIVPPFLTSREEEERQRILGASISGERVEKFRTDFLNARTQIGAIEKLFNWAGAFTQSTEVRPDLAFGFNVLVHKGPFVAQSNWGDLGAWEFAVAQEKHLLGLFNARLQDATTDIQTGTPEIPREPGPLLNAIASLLPELPGGHTAIVIAGELATDVHVELEKRFSVPGWELPEKLNTNWIIGMHLGHPVLYIGQHELSSLYAVNLRTFASLTQYAPSESDSTIDFRVLPISTERAQELSRARVGANPQELQMRVQLVLFQSYAFSVHNSTAVRKRSLSS